MSGFFRRWRLRQGKISKDALDGLPYEKFLRILGWFHTMVPAARKKKNAKGAYIDPAVREFDNIRALIVEKHEAEDLLFQRDELGGQVHNLNLILGKLLPAEALEAALISIRDEYRMRAAPETYATYTASQSYKALTGCSRPADAATKLRLLQADFVQLVNELRKLTLIEYHIEETRSYLIKKLGRTLYKLLIAPSAIVLLFLISRIDGNSVSPSTISDALVVATLLSLAAIAGAVGSFISVLLRVAAVPETNAVGQSVVALRYSESIRLAPLTGFIFAILLSFIFGGELLTGSLFPKTPEEAGAAWPQVLFDATECAKWLVWAFIVGFAERLMPDMIDRLVVKASTAAKPAAASAQGNGAKELVVADTPAGTNGAVKHPAAKATHFQKPHKKARA